MNGPRFRHAIVRSPGPDAPAGLTAAGLGRADPERLRAEHRAYCAALEAAGVELERLAPLPGLPDAYFVEDCAVLVPEVAVLTRPGAPARRPEVTHLEAAVERLLHRAGAIRAGPPGGAGEPRGPAGQRRIVRLEAPATLDGGDVLVAGREVWVGRSARSNRAGFEQLAAALSPHGYRCREVEVRGDLHLKSGAAHLGGGLLLLAPGYAAEPAFAGHPRIVLAEEERYACNSLPLDHRVLVPAGFPGLERALAGHGLEPWPLEVGEVRRMDGGLSCMSLRL